MAATHLTAILDRLAGTARPEPAIVTLTLDVAASGILPDATRVFLKNGALPQLVSDDHPAEARAALREAASRIRTYVDSELSPGTHGLYLAAGPDLWEPVELRVPLSNFMHVDRVPYLAPLEAAAARAPRILVARFDERSSLLQRLELGVWSEAGRWSPFLVDRDTERLMTGRVVGTRLRNLRGRTGIGGGKRDRFEQTLEAESARMLDELAQQAAALRGEAIFVFSDRERFAVFRDHLPVALRDKAESLGPAPRAEIDLRRTVEDRLAQRVLDRARAEADEFEERRLQGHLVAVGPDEVLAHRTTGRLARVFLDPEEAVPGSQCLACGALHPGRVAFCRTCEGAAAPVSLTQAIVAHARTHPPLAITYLPSPAAWLRELGGMAALLSRKAVRGRRV